MTEIDLGQASANDDVSGALTPKPDNRGPFTSGLHKILWHATDAAGNTGEAVQYLTVLPQADFSVDQMVSEGSNVTVTILLSGEAPAYPVKVPYIDSQALDGAGSSGMVIVAAAVAPSTHVRRWIRSGYS